MKFQLYLFRQLLGAFALAACGMVFIALPGIAVGAVHKLGSVGMMAVLRYLPLVVAGFVPYVLPVALLLSLVSTYGRLAAENEWTAIRMAGVNPYRLLLPAFALAAVVGCGIFMINAELLPGIRVRQKTVRIEELRNVFKNLSPGRTDVSLQGFYLQSAFRDPEQQNTFFDCFIEFPSKDGDDPKSFYAETVRFEFLEAEMVAHMYGVRGTEGVVQAAAEKLALSVNFEQLAGERDKRTFSSSRYKTSSEISAEFASMAADDPRRVSFLYAWHQRIANASTCLLFVFIGASTGVLMRKGTQLAALAVAVGYAILYWVLSLRLGKQLADSAVIEPWIGAWGPLLIFFAWGLFLMHRSLRE
ncbi:MAG: LptF/LptG family permease [bacterium]|jgi:lipopolysaccharide export LptBFGC system permease protein LptF|nr:YjgP/YjgQ family permease [Planctomycetota bacterium]HIL53030.1 YjgP/YjgQ family permease [Planctomycetota bacterium]